jgi:alpha-L-fucosidase
MNPFVKSFQNGAKFGLSLALMPLFLGAPKSSAADAPKATADTAGPYANETREQRDARMAWWREARFGMFIHWGVYSVPAGTYQGKQIPWIGEWIMNKGKIPVAEYKEFAKQFNPTKFNAEEWVKTAKAAGMKYIIITSKHHDGFAMFDSKANDWNIVKATPYAHDPLKDLAAACEKEGIRLGFYYSQEQDWTNGGAAHKGKWDKAQEHDMDDYIDKVAVPQVREILSNYGKISILWFDAVDDTITKARGEKFLPLLKLQPGIIYNDRLGADFNGDTETPEQHIPATGYKDRDWEACMTMNDTWGYKSYDNNFKSTEKLLRNLIDIASKGGNYLLNVGPDSTGVIPQPEVERLQQIGEWMKVNGEAIYGTTATPFGAETGEAVTQKDGYGKDRAASSSWAWRCTKKVTPEGATIYLHVFEWPKDGKFLVPGLKNKIAEAYLLNGHQTLTTTNGDDGVTISVPETAPDKIASVIALKIKGPLETVKAPAIQEKK